MKIVLSCVCAMFLAMPSTGQCASGYDVADLWWHPAESGWGMQLVQQKDVVFATMFVYNQANQPTWYSATLRFAGLNTSSDPVYNGQLVETRGPFWASPSFAPPTQVFAVGEMTFTAVNTAQAVLTYTINGVAVTKFVQRQTLVYEDFSGTYSGVYRVTMSGCSSASLNGSQNLIASFSISHANQVMNIAATMADGATSFTCSFTGTYTPLGSIGMFQGTYGCSTGESGNVTFAELRTHGYAISGRISSGRNNFGCSLTGRFAAIN